MFEVNQKHILVFRSHCVDYSCGLIDTGHPPVPCSECSQSLLSWQGLGLICQDPLHLLLYFPWQQQPSIIKHPHLEETALMVHGYVFALIHVL